MKVIIIGGIAAGMSAAAKLKRVNKEAEVIVYEKSSYISFGACGLPYFIGDFFESPEQMIARTPEAAREAGIDVKTEHEVLKVDPIHKSVELRDLKNGSLFTQSYDKLMIATGASAIVPPISNLQLENVRPLRSMDDGTYLKEKIKDPSIQKVGIIGAGFIGLEVVEAALQKGKEVHVFQLEERILKETFDKEVTDLLEEELIAKGVKLHLNSKVTKLEGKTKVEKIITEEEEISVDLVVLATGVRPNTAFIKETGIKMLPNGAIVIDQEGRTSLEGIYAAGDCATVPHLLKDIPSYIPLATSANKLGRIVGENLGGKSKRFEGTLGSSCIKVLEMEAGRTGLSEQEAFQMGMDYKTAFVIDKNQTSYYPGQQAIGIKLIYEATTKRLLGGQVVGKKDAVQRTNVLATAIYAGMTTEQLGMLDLCYAPPFSRTWDALNIAGNVAK